MSSLFSLLGLGSGALAAQQTGTGVAANNIPNVNTLGYSRQRVNLAAQLAAPLLGGVRAGAPERMASELLAGRIRVALAGVGYTGARQTASADLQQAVFGTGSPMDADLARLFATFDNVAASPLDRNLRADAVAQLQTVAAGIRDRASGIAGVRGAADTAVVDGARDATALAAQIAAANAALGTSDDPVLRDQRDTAATALAGLVGGAARIDPDGQMRFVLAGGGVLVDGQHAGTLVATPSTTTGFHTLELVAGANRRDVGAALTGASGGAIGAQLEVRDTTGAKAASDLDQLASDLATRLDTVHRGFAGLDGISGRDLFVPPAGVVGAAAALTVDPGIVADPGKLAAATVGAGPGDAAGAQALLAVRDALAASGGTRTFGDAAIDLVAGTGRLARDATSAADASTAVADGLAALHDSLAGVDLNAELADLSRFQHASAAMTRLVATVDSMLGDLISRL